MNISVVVLHYETIDDTKKCVQSLIENNTEIPFDIVVVDNGSLKGKIEHYRSDFDKRIHFISSESNLGFAKGNNLGYLFAKKHLCADVIVLANNDLVFDQKGFIKRLADYYEIHPFDVAGPKTISLKDGINQNPVRVNFHNVDEVRERLVKFKVLLCMNYLGVDNVIRNIISHKVEEFHIDCQDEEFQLHGACLLFGKKYIEKYDGLFDGTFMYVEEDFLLQRVLKNGFKMAYIDALEVKHKEGSSTNKSLKKPVRGRRFFYKWSIRSLELLIRYMNGEVQD